MQVVTETQPGKREWDDLPLGLGRIAHFVHSNAIVLVKELTTVGIGAGQMSGVDAVRIAVEKAGERTTAPPSPRTRSSPSTMARGLPSAPGSQAAIQPGGSVRDEEVIAAANEAGTAMVFTARRRFLR